MNRNLNPHEFGQLFDTADYVDVGAAKRAAQERNAARPPSTRAYGGSAHDLDRWGPEGAKVANPISSRAGHEAVEASFREHVNVLDADVAQDQFIPSYEITSPQGVVNPKAIDHLVENSTGLDVPNLDVVAGAGPMEGKYSIYDGNHRLNAALRRGQMLVPADVLKGF